ncbi:MAG: tyrosine-type recombinase/integrase [Deltaproteobacteria bacterium]|nr:tyrosine-type recombinase/integrase [Deltaproteobacteria bacterium]
MKAKPKGAKYRNLTRRGAVVYFEAVLDGQRVRFSTEEADWDAAAAVRDAYLRKRAERAGREAAHTFGALAERYLKEATGHLSGTTRDDRDRVLGADGELRRYFGAMRASDIRRATLLDWWYREVEGRGRHERTGLTLLSALSGVFGYAVDLELIDANPVDTFRGTLRRRRRSKRGRAEAAQGGSIRPIEEPAQLGALVTASRVEYERRFGNGRPRREAQASHVATLLMLDAGLRAGEVAGLRWRDVRWGGDPDDVTRALVIRASVARGKYEEAPKSGRSREVALSRRLRRLLREFYVAQGQPEPSARVLPGYIHRNYQGRHFEGICAAAGLAGRTPKDLRDTFASQLLTAGIQLGYISGQLGHQDVATTARHYATWAGAGAYRRALEVEPGEVPADLIARIEAIESPHKSPHLAKTDGASA